MRTDKRNVVHLASTPQLAQVAWETCCLLCWWETNRTCHWAPGACLRSTAPAAPTLGVQLGRHWRGPPETRVSVTAAAVDGVATQYGCCSGSTAASRLGRTTCSAVQPHLVRPPAPVDEHRVYVNGGTACLATRITGRGLAPHVCQSTRSRSKLEDKRCRCKFQSHLHQRSAAVRDQLLID